jgi:hypothetical protein
MQQIIFIADLIACSTCFRHHYAHHQELENIIQVVTACRIWSSCRYSVELRVMCPVCGLLPHINDDARSKSHQTFITSHLINTFVSLVVSRIAFFIAHQAVK